MASRGLLLPADEEEVAEERKGHIIRSNPQGALLILTLVSVMNQIDRGILAVVIPSGLQCDIVKPTNQTDAPSDDFDDCINFSSLEQGLLTGIAFTAAHTALLLVRMALGIGEAGCNPISFSLISDYFKSERRAFALSVYLLGICELLPYIDIGGGASYFLGILNEDVGWRTTFLILAVPGLILVVVVVAFLREPQRGQNDSATLFFKSSQSIAQVYRCLVQNHVFLLLLCASSIRMSAGYSLGAWTATFYKDYHKKSGADIGLPIGLIVLFGGGSGALIGGWLGDRFIERSRGSKAYVAMASSLLAVPFTVGFLVVEKTQDSFVFLFLSYLFAEMWIGPSAAMVQNLFLAEMRSQASAVYGMANALIGSCGPLIIGAAIDDLKKKNHDEGDA
eukprot:UC4_evm1s1080